MRRNLARGRHGARLRDPQGCDACYDAERAADSGIPPQSPVVPQPARQPVVIVEYALEGDRIPMGVFGATYEGVAPCAGYVARIGKAVAFAPERAYRAARRARIARGEGA